MSEQDHNEPLPEPKTGVPVEMIDTLHKATDQLSRARHHMEEAIDANVNSLTERERASHEISDAEKEVEEADARIRTKLAKPL